MNGQDIVNNILSRLGQNGKHVWKYYNFNGAWCVAEVSYTLEKVGLKSKFYDGKPCFYVPYAQQWLHNNAKIIYEKGSGSIANAQPGDIVIFTWNPWSRDHIGFCYKEGTSTAMNTIEGNTNGGVVAIKSRAKKYIYGVYRLKCIDSTPYDYHLVVDGEWGRLTSITLQHLLGVTEDGDFGKNSVKALQKLVGTTVDGAWGKNTTKALQRFLNKQLGIALAMDGVRGPATTKALQTWCNNKLDGVVMPKETNGNKLATIAKQLAWPLGTAESKWSYKTGSPTSACKTAMNQRGYTSKKDLSDCGYFMNTVYYKLYGKKIKFLAGSKEAFPSTPSGMSKVIRGTSIKESQLKPGDIIRYKKSSTSQHALMYLGGGLIAEGGRGSRFPVVKKSTKYEGKKNLIEVLRAKD